MNFITIIIIAVLEIVVIHSIAQYIGTKRKIGYGKSVFWSIVLTPVIGLIITLSSKKLDKQ
jgi:Na+-driven multidrug efflux pump